MRSPTASGRSSSSWNRAAALLAVACLALFIYYVSKAGHPIDRTTLSSSLVPQPPRLSTIRCDDTQHPCICPFAPPQGTNSNGGWFYNKRLISRAHVSFDPGFGEELIRFIKKGTVVDIGAGVGQLGYFIGQKLGSRTKPIQWCGYDGGNNIHDFWGEHAPLKDDPNYHVPRVCWIDASSKLNSTAMGKYDWSITIEVGEHIPKSSEQVFLDNIVSLAKKGVVMSWAIPGQSGYQHINNQPNEYIIAEMEKRGLNYNKAQSMLFRKSVTRLPWLRNTIMVFEF